MVVRVGCDEAIFRGEVCTVPSCFNFVIAKCVNQNQDNTLNGACTERSRSMRHEWGINGAFSSHYLKFKSLNIRSYYFLVVCE